MLKFRFHKLVRDKIVQHQIGSGSKPIFRVLSPDEHKRELVQKIIEEAREITNAKPEEVAAEIADVQQALDDLKEKYGVSKQAVARAQKIKNDKNGAFKNGDFIDYVEIDENDKWVEYYRANSDRYPEIQ